MVILRMLTELFEELCQYPSFSIFTDYEPELCAWNPQRMLIYYVDILKREMDKDPAADGVQHLPQRLL